MFRLAPGLRAGIIAAALWLGSGVAFALIVWFRLYRSDIVRLVVGETIPVGTWQLGMPWPVLIPLASSVAFGAAVAWGVGRLPTAPRPASMLAAWMVAVLAGGAVGSVTGIGALIGNGMPTRAALLAQGVPDAAGLGLACGLLVGWVPALVSLEWGRARTARDGDAGVRRVPAIVSGAVALAAGATLVAAIGVTTAQQRLAGLEGAAPPAIQQAEPAPAAVPPPPIAPGDHPIDPSWCLPAQLLLQAGGADAATGHRDAIVFATNTSDSTCILPGYPDVAFADQNGGAVEVTVREGAGFMTEDPGPAPFELKPGENAIAYLAWDATDGRTLLNQIFLAPYPGAERSVTFVDPPFDITAQTEVAVTAWAPTQIEVTLTRDP